MKLNRQAMSGCAVQIPGLSLIVNEINNNECLAVECKG
jgi:hypothetical protein